MTSVKNMLSLYDGYNVRCHRLKEVLPSEYKARCGTISCRAKCQFVQCPTSL